MPSSPAAPFLRDTSAQAWHARTAEQVLELLQTDDTVGLSADEARRRLDEHGPNRLAEVARRGPLTRAVAQFDNPLILVVRAMLASHATVPAPGEEAAGRVLRARPGRRGPPGVG